MHYDSQEKFLKDLLYKYTCTVWYVIIWYAWNSPQQMSNLLTPIVLNLQFLNIQLPSCSHVQGRRQGTLKQRNKPYTLPETKIAPENRPSQKGN